MKRIPLVVRVLLLAIAFGCGKTQEQFVFPGKVAVTVVDAPGAPSSHFAGETALYIVLPGGEEYSPFPDTWHSVLWGGWRCPRWSPNGDRLAVVNWNLMAGSYGPYGYQGTLYIVDIDSREMADMGITNSCAMWSSSGTQLLFSLQDTLYTMDVAAQVRTPLGQLSPPALANQLGWSPSWAPDGAKMVYDTGDAIYEMDGTGSLTTQMIGPCTECSFSDPRYSPDGRWIVFRWNQPGETRDGIYRMDRDGSQVTWLHAGSSPRWSPDGSQIAFLWESGTEGIWVMAADGSNVRMLVRSPQWRYVQFDWGP